MQEQKISLPLDDRDFNKSVAKDRMFLGMFAEHLTAADCYRRGYRVSRPGDGSSVYDLIVDRHGLLTRLQVKTLSSKGQVAVGYLRYSEDLYDGKGSRQYVEPKYKSGDFDFLCFVDRDSWRVYYIPFEDIDWSKTSMSLSDEQRERYVRF